MKKNAGVVPEACSCSKMWSDDPLSKFRTSCSISETADSSWYYLVMMLECRIISLKKHRFIFFRSVIFPPWPPMSFLSCMGCWLWSCRHPINRCVFATTIICIPRFIIRNSRVFPIFNSLFQIEALNQIRITTDTIISINWNIKYINKQ